MTASVNQDFVTYAGDAITPIFTVQDASGNAVDISTVTEIVWTVQRDPTSSVLLTKKKSTGQITFVTTGADGQFQVAILTADTAALKGYYVHTATITDGFGSPTTVTVGRLQVGQTPAWSYDPAQIASVPMYQVRYYVGDTVEDDQLITDTEITFSLTQYSNVLLAAAECARNISGRFARMVDLVTGEMKTNYSQRSKSYRSLAVDLEQRGHMRGANLCYAGGMSVSDKQANTANTDLVQPQFVIGMDDNLIVPGGYRGIQRNSASGEAEEPQ